LERALHKAAYHGIQAPSASVPPAPRHTTHYSDTANTSKVVKASSSKARGGAAAAGKRSNENDKGVGNAIGYANGGPIEAGVGKGIGIGTTGGNGEDGDYAAAMAKALAWSTQQ